MIATETETILTVVAPPELNAMTFTPFRDKTRASILPAHQRLDVDMEKTTFVDSSGLGALIALQKTMGSRSGSVRLLNPRQNVLQILELTRMHRIFEITRAA